MLMFRLVVLTRDPCYFQLFHLRLDSLDRVEMFFQNRQGLSRKRFEIRVGEVLFELRPYRPYPIPWFLYYRQDAGNK